MRISLTSITSIICMSKCLTNWMMRQTKIKNKKTIFIWVCFQMQPLCIFYIFLLSPLKNSDRGLCENMTE
ncbi:hypothetical protein PRUPE_1G031000 [Prunus persica]|uniref:Uncharacterized protein n=1 Tax=Prunus persica TaxID=3760 RepID=A0A251QRZ1_PRUPE|nr:hypothetical protein PRUPE_1G031000 [Prunus persica]